MDEPELMVIYNRGIVGADRSESIHELQKIYDHTKLDPTAVMLFARCQSRLLLAV